MCLPIQVETYSLNYGTDLKLTPTVEPYSGYLVKKKKKILIPTLTEEEHFRAHIQTIIDQTDISKTRFHSHQMTRYRSKQIITAPQ